eukprot:CAMPEP_0116862078 /NCGR_PEP_ID=MMETSP0418-20121206/23425_1 /TAXON_ID=1158023 /ORGANISM="Astrosyne radiata, Strain 13vi08-1A" /LENGTH=90 /DNA_ID=CAMNT_0004496865 /DNA_START=65 /DNA_END=334 /DNA_ORIENTATION=+
MGEDDIISLAQALESNDSLTELVLNLNRVGENGTKTIAKCLGPENGLDAGGGLKQLDFEGCGIGQDGIQTIVGALKTNKRLTRLNLQGNK